VQVSKSKKREAFRSLSFFFGALCAVLQFDGKFPAAGFFLFLERVPIAVSTMGRERPENKKEQHNGKRYG